MKNIKVIVHPGAWASESVTQFFRTRKNHSLINIAGALGYVMDDTNRIRQVPLDHIEVVDMEGDSSVETIQQYLKKNPGDKVHKDIPNKTVDYPQNPKFPSRLSAEEQQTNIDKVKPVKESANIDKVKPLATSPDATKPLSEGAKLSEEERMASGDDKLKKTKGVNVDETTKVTESEGDNNAGTPD